MKKAILALAIIYLATACKKSTESGNNKTTTKVFIKVEALDNDYSTTETSVATVTITQ